MILAACVWAACSLWLLLPLRPKAARRGAAIVALVGFAVGGWLVIRTLGLSEALSTFFFWTTIAAGVAAVICIIKLPRPARPLGVLMGLVSLTWFGWVTSSVTPLGQTFAANLFWVTAGVTMVAATGTVSSPNPVYSAMWFGLTLLGTAALFLVNGAQFLAVATVVVYAGAILVTFLFVLMLANPKGQAYYDRISWGWLPAGLSVAAGVAIVFVLTATLFGVFDASAAEGKVGPLHDRVTLEAGILSSEHVASLGAQLFSRHLIAVEVAGTMLLVALVAAVTIIGQGQSRRSPGTSDKPTWAAGVKERGSNA